MLLQGAAGAIFRGTDWYDSMAFLEGVEAHDISPDGSRVLATDPLREYRSRLLVIDPVTEERSIVFRAGPNEVITRAQWSPDGGSVAYGLDVYPRRVAEPPLGQPDLRTICILEVIAETRACYPRLSRVNGFDWSPDGAALVVDVLGEPEVMALDVASGDVSSVVPRGGDGSIRRAVEEAGLVPVQQFIDTVWSPSGNYLATLAFVQGGDAFTVPLVLRADGSFVALGRPSGEFAGAFGWSPEDDILAYTQGMESGKGPQRITETYLLDVEDAQERLLISGAHTTHPHILALEWSPSGRWVAIARSSLMGEVLQIVEVSGPERIELPASDHIRDWGP
jgi:dipeptidyl aminopeptidase/acylaminoacyl peptidase